MAQEWCIAYGVLPAEEAAKLYKAVCKRKGQKAEAGSTPKKATPAKKRKTSS